MQNPASILKNNASLVREAGEYVRALLRDQLPSGYLFHNIDRILERISLSGDFIEAMDLSEEEATVLALAIWFQDAGYIESAEDHLSRSIALAREFLEKREVEESLVQQVVQLILHTGEDREPETELEKILHDINWSFLGEKRFFGLGNLLRLERENIYGESYSSQDWNEKLRDQLVRKNYYTYYGRESFLDRKIKNIAKQRKRLRKARENDIRRRTGKDFGRGVDTVYRVTFRNHINLSRIADGKANMIITINTGVLSLLITTVSGASIFYRDNYSELSGSWYFIIPLVILMLSSLAAIVFAVLSALPKVSSAHFTEEELNDHKVSLLYFGNFLQLPENKFVGYLRELKTDQEILYDDLSRDLYNLGKVLKKKYGLLTVAYRIFMGGLVLSMLALLITLMVFFF